MKRPAVRPPQPKKPYRAPRLAVHGNLAVLTKTKGGRGSDGGKPSTRNTGFPG